MKQLKKIISCIFYTFLMLLVSLCVYTFISIDILGKNYANIFGYTYFVVASGSMSGTVEVDDIVIVSLNADYETNDIITFQNDSGEFITHRYIKKVNDKLVTRGDVNNTEDEPISKSQVVGKVVKIISPSFIFKLLAIGVIIAILIILFNFDKIFKKVVKEEKKDKENEAKEKKVVTIKTPPSTGDTIKIPIGEISNLQNNKNTEIEFLETDEISYEIEKKYAKEEKFLRKTVALLKLKNDSLLSSKINKNWLEKYRHIYKLSCVIHIEDKIELESMLKKKNFEELYDYDMEDAGLYENLINKLHEMPIYVYLQILVFAILYNDLEFFDGVYKILKYKVQIDKSGEFTRIGKSDFINKKKIKELLEFMMKISNKFDEKGVLKLDKIQEYVKLKKYINE